MEKLDALECHFTWITDEQLEDLNVPNLIEYMTIDITKESDDIEVLARPFIAFLRAQGDESDLDMALEEAVKAIDLCDKSSTEPDYDRRQGYKIVALSNKAHIQHLLGLNDGLNLTLKEIESLEKKKESSNKIKASILGMHGFALSHMGNCYPESVVLFREAEDLDPGNFHWPLGRGLATGRLFRREKQVNPKSSVLEQLDIEQEESLQQAVDLTDGTHYISLVHLADVYYWRGRGIPCKSNTQDRDLLARAKKLYMKAYDMHPDCPMLLKRIGKAFPEIDRNDEPFAEKCLLRAEELDPRNSMLLHRLGQFYEHAEGPKRDYKKAEEYYKDAITSGSSRNLPAEMDLGRVRRKMNKDYDLKQHMTDLLKVYPREEHQTILQNRIHQISKNVFRPKSGLERAIKNLHL